MSWIFSGEVEPELNKFLKAVNRNNSSCRVKDVLQTVLSREIPNQSVQKIEQDIVLDDNTQKQEITEPFNDTTIINLVEDAEESVLDVNVHDFLKYVQEALEMEDNVLEKKDIVKLATDYNTHTLTYVFSKVNESLTDQALYNLTRTVCLYSDEEFRKVSEQFCRIILLDKVKSVEPSQLLQLAVKKFLETYTQISRTELLIPFLKYSATSKWLQLLMNMLSEVERENFLRDFIYSCNELEEWQLLTIQSLLTNQTADDVKRRLINLLEATADKFSTEKLFVRLVIKVIQSLGKGFEDQEETLFNIVDKNKSLLKNSAHKTLKEWVLYNA